jgi:hypothetical protein
MKLINIFNKNKSNTYFDLPSRDRKKIVNGAVKQANLEQYNLVKEYGKRVVSCNSLNK